MTSDRPSSRRALRRPGPRRGWLLVATLAVTETTSYGVLTYAFGVFLLPMQHDLGWSRTALTGAYSLAIILSGVAAIPVGRWLDRHGARALMTAGSVAATALVLAWARVTDLRSFYAIWAGIGVVMAAVLYEPAFAVIATWFRDGAERTRALLALTVVAGFASVIYLPLAGWLVQTQGWRDALVTLAVLLVPLTVLPNATLPGRRPDHLERQPGQEPATPPATSRPDGVPLARAPRPGAVVAGRGVLCRHPGHLHRHRPPGRLPPRAAVLPRVRGDLDRAPRRHVGRRPRPGHALGRRWPLALATAAVFALQAVAVVVLTLSSGPAGVVGFVALFGLGVGLISFSRAALVADFYGVAAYASINGVLALTVTIARAAAPVAAAALRTASGSYHQVMAAIAVCSILASLAIARAHWLHARHTIASPG
jgi:MFS family permease